MGAMKVWDGTTWQTVAPFSERASCYVGPDQPAGVAYAGDLWWDTDDPTIAYPGAELAYAQITASVNLTATTEAAAQTVISTTLTLDGSPIIVEFYTPQGSAPNVTGSFLNLNLWDGSTNMGFVHSVFSGTAAYVSASVNIRRRITPTVGSHTYSIRGYVGSSGTGVVAAGAGGAGAWSPAFIRVTRV